MLLSVLLAAGGLFLLHFFFLKGGGPGGAAKPDFPFPEGLDRYSFQLVFHPQQQKLAVTLDLHLRNRESLPLHDLVLRTHAGAFARADTSPAAGAGLYEACYPDGFSPGGILIHDTLWEGGHVPSFFEDEARTALTIRIPPLLPGAWGTLRLRCVLSVPDCLYRFGRSEDAWFFGSCLPILAYREEGRWRSDPYVPVGDPFVSGCADYMVSLSLPRGYACAASAPLAAAAGVDSQLLAGEVRGAREFSLAIFRGYVLREGKAGGVRVRSWAREAAGAQRALNAAQEALEAFGRDYGAYPWPEYTLVEHPFPFSGMEYPALAFIGTRHYAKDHEDALELAVVHETAHQWFYALVGSDQYREPWQDEALCEHALLGYVQDRYGPSARENLKALRVDAALQERVREGLAPASPLDAFLDNAEYAGVVYGRGAAAMEALELHTGGIKAFLREYIRANAYGFARRDDFVSALNLFFGEDLAPLLNDYLDASL